jgi:hypothetical protein
MKPPLKLFQITTLAASAALVLSACNTRYSAPEAENVAETESSLNESTVESVAAADTSAAEADVESQIGSLLNQSADILAK